jgi:hypothetical protein
MSNIHPDNVLAALSKANGNHFEAFFKEFMSAIRGETFIPLGGTHDGGADAFSGERIYESKKAGVFYQASIQADYRAKIRSTIRRLREFGRKPTSLTYVTSRIIDTIDVVEEDLTEELSTIIRIRDGAWIANNLNKDNHSRASYLNHLAPLLSSAFGQNDRPNIRLAEGDNVSACVFLSYEVESQAGKMTLLQSVTDSLIIWALEDTKPDNDPAKSVMMSKEDIEQKILQTFPFAKHFLSSQLEHRLNRLSSKGGENHREVRSYKRQGLYCLPHETRELIKDEHNRISALLYRVKEQLKECTISDIKAEVSDGRIIEGSINPDEVVSIIMASLEETFSKEGLKVGLIASGQDDAPELTCISDCIDEQILESRIKPEVAVMVRDLCISGMRKLFYNSTDDQRHLLQTLSRTYSFLFSMKYEPRIVEYFQGMRAKFHLYVGSDILVRALSEAFLPEDDRATENMMKLLRECGSTLVLTEPTLDEVWTHIISTDTEFQQEWSAIEPKVDSTLASQAPRILIRSYFYAAIDKKSAPKFKGWSSYLEHFCNYSVLRKSEGKDSLRVERQVDQGELEKIAQQVTPLKKNAVVARNDALMVLLVYARRKANRERYSSNPYGYTTWWLTQEARIQSAISDVVKSNGGKCIIRPEFLMYYLSMLPRKEEVDDLYTKAFPSLYGVKLGQRVKPELVHDVLSRARHYMTFDQARVSMELKAFADKLKADQGKQYSLANNNR